MLRSRDSRGLLRSACSTTFQFCRDAPVRKVRTLHCAQSDRPVLWSDSSVLSRQNRQLGGICEESRGCTCALLERCRVCQSPGPEDLRAATSATSSSATSLGFSGEPPVVANSSFPPTCAPAVFVNAAACFTAPSVLIHHCHASEFTSQCGCMFHVTRSVIKHLDCHASDSTLQCSA